MQANVQRRKFFAEKAWPYAAAFLAIVLVTVIRLGSSPVLGDRAVFLLQIAVVLIVAWLYGTWPATLAAALGGIAGTAMSLLLTPEELGGTAMFLNLGLYVLVCMLVLVISQLESLARARLQAAEETARQSDNRARTLLNASPYSVLLLRPDGTVEDANAAAASAFKVTLAELVGREAYWHLDPETAEGRRRLLARAVQTRAPVEFEDVPFGRRIRNYIHPVLDTNGAVTHLAAFGKDITEQAEAEQEVRRRGEFLSLALTHANAGVWQWDIATGRLQWSEEVYTHFGLPVGTEPNFTNLLNIVVPEDREAMKRETQRSMDDKGRFELRFRIRRPDGSVRWIHSRGRTLCDDKGQPCQMSGVALDVTERVAAEEALRQTQQEYRRLVETANEGVWLLDAQACTTFVNAKMASLLGYTADEMRGKHLFAFMDDEGRRVAERNWERRKQGIAEAHDFCFRRKDGTELWALVSTNPIHDADGTYRGALGMITDVTQRHNAEQMLARSERHYRLLFETMMQGVIWQATDGSVTSMNPAAEEILGRSSGDYAAGGPGADEYPALHEDGTVFPGPEHPSTVALRTGKPVRNVVMGVYNPRQGAYRWINLNSVPQFEPGADRPAAVFTVFDDITERREKQRALEQVQHDLMVANAELERRVQERTEELNAFCHSVAHDLRGPLRTQVSVARLLLDDFGTCLGEEGSRFARQIAQAAERQSAIVSDLLAHMSLAHGDMALEPLALRECLELVREDLQAELRETQATVQFCGTDSVSLMANRSSLHLVLLNLLSNAMKFVLPGTQPQITVTAETLDSKVRVSVRDNGIGIAPEHHKRVFQLFQRLHPRGKYPGTGMGLANVKKAVERMGGCVGLESTPGQGSRFWFELNAVAETDSPALPARPNAAADLSPPAVSPPSIGL